MLHTPQLKQYWQQRFPPSPGTFRIGIAWQGNPDHQADAYRSLPLNCFERLAEIPNVELVSLQRGAGTEAKSRTGMVQGFDATACRRGSIERSVRMDTVAIMHTLDLVITSDTAIAHLAGALGIRAWIALGYTPD